MSEFFGENARKKYAEIRMNDPIVYGVYRASAAQGVGDEEMFLATVIALYDWKEAREKVEFQRMTQELISPTIVVERRLSKYWIIMLIFFSAAFGAFVYKIIVDLLG